MILSTRQLACFTWSVAIQFACYLVCHQASSCTVAEHNLLCYCTCRVYDCVVLPWFSILQLAQEARKLRWHHSAHSQWVQELRVAAKHNEEKQKVGEQFPFFFCLPLKFFFPALLLSHTVIPLILGALWQCLSLNHTTRCSFVLAFVSTDGFWACHSTRLWMSFVIEC